MSARRIRGLVAARAAAFMLSLAFATPSAAADEISAVTLRTVLGDMDSRFVITRRPGGAVLAFTRSDGVSKTVSLGDKDWNDVAAFAAGAAQGEETEICPRKTIELSVWSPAAEGPSRGIRACFGSPGAGARLARLADALGAVVLLRK